MSFIYYIAADSKVGKIVSIAVGVSSDPEEEVSNLDAVMPFKMRLLGLELGSLGRLEAVRHQFRGAHIRGSWFQPSEELQTYVSLLPAIDRSKNQSIRVSLDLNYSEHADLERFVEELGSKTKARLLRRAFRFYQALHRYKAQGFLIQAVKGGTLIQFPDLDDIKGDS